MTAYYEKEFQEYRHRCGITESDYIASLSRCSLEKTTGGKSGASFYRTKDKKYFLKESLTNWAGGERESFLAFVPTLLEHLKVDQPTFIARPVGFCEPSRLQFYDLSLNSSRSTRHTQDEEEWHFGEAGFRGSRESLCQFSSVSPLFCYAARILTLARSNHVAIRSQRHHFSIRQRTGWNEAGRRLDQRRFSDSHLLSFESSHQVCARPRRCISQCCGVTRLLNSGRCRWFVDS